ncbi:MAG: LuxR C-terminal-related transcriptional regulator [Ktedonobacteraceae bacterium]
MSLRLLLVDLRSTRLMGLRLLLSQEQSRVEFIDEVTVANALAYKLSTGAFDLVIAHHSLVPDITILPSNHFVLLVAQPDKALFQAARDHGALAYLSENPSEELLRATLYLCPGDFLIDPTFTHCALNGAVKNAEPCVDADWLTERERAIVALREGGFSLHDIADRLCVTKSTVKRHLANISAKRKQRREQE